MVCGLPTMPKRGAVSMTMRRSFSFGLPVRRACTGPLMPALRRVGGNVVHLAVGQEDRAGEALRRNIGERLIERREEPRAVLVGGDAGARGHDLEFGVAEASRRFLSSSGLGVRRSADSRAADGLALAPVDHGDGDIGQLLALLVADRGIEKRRAEKPERQRAQRPSPRAADGASGDQPDAQPRSAGR